MTIYQFWYLYTTLKKILLPSEQNSQPRVAARSGRPQKRYSGIAALPLYIYIYIYIYIYVQK